MRSPNKASLKLLHECRGKYLARSERAREGCCNNAESQYLAVPIQNHETPKSGKGRLGWENSSFLPVWTLLKWKLVIQLTCSLCVHSYNTLIQTLTYFKNCQTASLICFWRVLG